MYRVSYGPNVLNVCILIECYFMHIIIIIITLLLELYCPIIIIII